MIMASKHIPLRDSLLASGGVVLAALQRPTTISTLWERLQRHVSISSFGSLVLALDFLFLIGAVHLDQDGLVARRQS